MAVAIVGALGDFADLLGTALNDRGHHTMTVRQPASRDELGAAFMAAEVEYAEPLDLVRLAGIPEQFATSVLATLPAEAWVEQTSQPLRQALAFHQAAADHLADRGGRVVVVVPTTALTGAAGAVTLATTAEAERSLVKSQARALGRYAITVNCIAVASDLLTGQHLDRPGLQAQSLPAPSVAELAGVIDSLLGEGFNGVTGQTIAVDGGRWSAP